MKESEDPMSTSETNETRDEEKTADVRETVVPAGDPIIMSPGTIHQQVDLPVIPGKRALFVPTAIRLDEKSAESLVVRGVTCGGENLYDRNLDTIPKLKGRTVYALKIVDPPPASCLIVELENLSITPVLSQVALGGYVTARKDAGASPPFSLEALLEKCADWFGEGMGHGLIDRKLRDLAGGAGRGEEEEEEAGHVCLGRPPRLRDKLRLLAELVLDFAAIPFSAAVQFWEVQGNLENQADLEEPATGRLASLGLGPVEVGPHKQISIPISSLVPFRPISLVLDPAASHDLWLHDVRVGRDSQMLVKSPIAALFCKSGSCGEGGLPIAARQSAGPGLDITVEISNEGEEVAVVTGVLVGLVPE